MSTALESGLDVERIRADFPILGEKARGKPLVYLDNAATTQKPQAVIDAVSDFYRHSNANVHRGVHDLSERATLAFESARRTVQRFLGAASEREVIFTRGTTESINLVANTWGVANVHEGDEVLITEMEHHSNIVPWQLLCERVGARLVVVPIDDDGALKMDEFRRLVSDRTRIVAVTWISNALGTVNPVREIVEFAHARDIPVLVDGAQATLHRKVDVTDLGCDFFAFSGHKVYGPTGIGALYGRLDLLEEMPPWQGGGDMILSVSFDRTVYNKVPAKFEAGTPNIAGAIGLAAALEYLEDIGIERVQAHEDELLEIATAELEAVPGLRFIGTAENKTSVLSFVIDGVHPHDIGTVMDMQGVAIRAGHHCAQPVMERFGLAATTRASLALYNNREDIDRLLAAVREAVRILG